MKNIFDSKPDTFVDLESGYYYYNYDIQEFQTKVLNENEEYEDATKYTANTVRIFGTPTVHKCFEAVLKELKDSSNTSLYNVLLTEGSNDEIEEVKYNVKVDFGVATEKSPLQKAQEEMIKKISDYDVSLNVNSFTLNGLQVWLSKDTRVGLMNSLNIEKNSGKEESTLWLGSMCIVVNCDSAIQMLSDLELYALACYNKTAEHKKNVNELTDITQVKSYDYTVGYPDKLVFTI